MPGRSGTHMEFEPTVSAVRLYSTYKSWWFTGILHLALAVLLALAIFEEPTVSSLNKFSYHKYWATVSCSCSKKK